jgi:asparagine synthase (glutamine-hydrolysing)
MSGFAGIVSLDGAPPDALLLQRMAERLAFRGPDGTHITTKPGAGFCFTFLRTGPAPQCASQPCSLDGRVWLLGDVRLDGREDLRRKLEQHGDEIAAEATDEELVLRAWRRWGEDSLPDLLGDFSFALWDGEARQLWCARDLMGARPFFYAQSGNRLYFSNTLDAVRCAPDISSALDHDFIGDFLLQGWCSYPQRTALRDISRLPAGHTLCSSSAGIEVRRFSSLPIEEPLWLKREEEYVERFRELLETAVRERLPSGRVAIFMSGGLDSTSVAAVAVNSAKKNKLRLDLRAYTIDYQPLFDDKEGFLASRAAEYLGIPIEIEAGASCLPFEGWGGSLPPTPEPCHEPFRQLHIGQNRQAAKHARIAFNGLGGDGVLTGQAWPYLVDRIKNGRLAEVARTFGGYMLRHGRIPPLRGGFHSALRRFIKPNNPIAKYPRWLAPQFEREIRLRDRWCELQRPLESDHPWHPKAHAALFLSSTILENEEPPLSGVPLECRAPLVDVRVQRFLLRIPPVPLCIDKQLLRRALHDLLPKEILMRPKTGFQGDPVVLQMTKNNWTPLPLAPPTESILQFVTWPELSAALQKGSLVFPWAELRPVALEYWLRGIESGRSIQ